MSAVDSSTRYIKVSQLCGYTATASWLTVMWDGITTLDDEVMYIWPMPWTAHIKWLYLFGKYAAWVLQTAVFAIEAGYLMHHPISLHYCRLYRFIEMAVNAVLMLCFDTVLLLRIYALYGLRTRSSTLGTLGVIMEFALTVVASILSIPAAPFDSRCVMIEVPKTIFVFQVGTFVSQAILVWLAYHRRERSARARSSIACITIRDGLIVFVCFAVYLTLSSYWTLHNNPITTAMIFVLPMVICVATCRVILNLQRTRGKPIRDSTQQLTPQEFTTDVYGVYGSADSFLLSDGPFGRRGPE